MASAACIVDFSLPFCMLPTSCGRTGELQPWRRPLLIRSEYQRHGNARASRLGRHSDPCAYLSRGGHLTVSCARRGAEAFFQAIDVYGVLRCPTHWIICGSKVRRASSSRNYEIKRSALPPPNPGEGQAATALLTPQQAEALSHDLKRTRIPQRQSKLGPRLRQLGQRTLSPWNLSVYSKHEKHVVIVGSIQKRPVARFIGLVHGQRVSKILVSIPEWKLRQRNNRSHRSLARSKQQIWSPCITSRTT